MERKRGVVAAILLLVPSSVAGCASGGASQIKDVTQAYTAHLNLKKAWWITFAPRPDPTSPANRLKRSRAYQSAVLSYYDEPGITAQFPPEVVEDLKKSGSAFDYRADLDQDGAVEQYRTGFARRSDGSRTSFLAAWENGQLLDIEFEEGQKSPYAFSVLSLRPDDRKGTWLFCLACGDSVSFSLQDNRLKFLEADSGQ